MPSPAPDAGDEPGADAPFKLELAAEPSLLPTARLFAAGVARQAGCSEERVEDVKLAISEACGVALGAEATSIRIEARSADGGVVFDIGPIRDPAGPVDIGGVETPLPRGLDLIALVFEDAHLEPTKDGERGVIRFSAAERARAGGPPESTGSESD